jgi:hypothetical protein
LKTQAYSGDIKTQLKEEERENEMDRASSGRRGRDNEVSVSIKGAECSLKHFIKERIIVVTDWV